MMASQMLPVVFYRKLHRGCELHMGKYGCLIATKHIRRVKGRHSAWTAPAVNL